MTLCAFKAKLEFKMIKIAVFFIKNFVAFFPLNP